MKELIVECIVVFHDGRTEYTAVDVTILLGHEPHFKSVKDYVKENHPEARDVIVMDVLHVKH